MMLARPLATDPSYDTLAAMGLTMGDDIACYCWDYHDGQCHDAVDFPATQSYVQFRIGDSQFDDPAAGVYHVGVAEPLWIEMVLDTVNDVLDLYATSPDGRLNDTLISHSSFCDSPDNTPNRYNPNPHRYGNVVWLGDPFYALPLSTVPADCWHQMGQWRLTAAVDGAPLTRQGPPAGFVQ